MISTNAILIAATLIVLGLIVLVGVVMYFGLRFLTTVAILKSAPDAKSAAVMLFAAHKRREPKAPEKQPMDMPATGIDELADNPEAMATLRKRQNPSSDSY